MAIPQPVTNPWQHCLHRLGGEIPQQQFNTWIRPLQAEWCDSGLVLSAPNRFIRDFVVERYVPMISAYLIDVVSPAVAQVSVTVAGDVAGAPSVALSNDRQPSMKPTQEGAAVVRPLSLIHI